MDIRVLEVLCPIPWKDIGDNQLQATLGQLAVTSTGNKLLIKAPGYYNSTFTNMASVGYNVADLIAIALRNVGTSILSPQDVPPAFCDDLSQRVEMHAGWLGLRWAEGKDKDPTRLRELEQFIKELM